MGIKVCVWDTFNTLANGTLMKSIIPFGLEHEVRSRVADYGPRVRVLNLIDQSLCEGYFQHFG